MYLNTSNIYIVYKELVANIEIVGDMWSGTSKRNQSRGGILPLIIQEINATMQVTRVRFDRPKPRNVRNEKKAENPITDSFFDSIHCFF